MCYCPAQMEEITVNLHNHSVISDGTGNYYEIAQAGLNAKIDVLIITDHNVVVRGKDSYYYREGNKLLLLIGEEINDPIGVPGNHLIILNSSREYASAASDPQTVIDSVNKERGITILAHPFENAKKQLHMKSFPWSDWNVHDFSGLEIYNFMSQFKCGVTNFFSLPNHYLRPINFQMGADENTLAKWDELLCMGYRVSGFAGSDSHRFQKKIGPKTFKIFDYELTCRALNNHVYIPKPLVGDVEEDKKVIYAALRNGCFFVGADMITSTAGKSSILTLLRQGELEQALDMLPDSGGVITHLKSRYHNLEKEKNKGLISQENYQLAWSTISNSLLEILEKRDFLHQPFLNKIGMYEEGYEKATI